MYSLPAEPSKWWLCCSLHSRAHVNGVLPLKKLPKCANQNVFITAA